MLHNSKKKTRRQTPRHLSEKQGDGTRKKMINVLGDPPSDASHIISQEEIAEWFEKVLSEIEQKSLKHLH